MKHYQNFLLAGAILCSGASALARPMTAILNVSERVSMNDLAASVLDPDSDRFGEYYTPEEIRNLVAPSDSDYAQLLQTLRSEGFTIAHESISHLIITIKADHTLFEKVFRTSIQFPGGKFHTNAVSPQIPSELSLISSVSGLNNTHKLKPLYKKVPMLDDSSDQPGILPADIKTAYGLNPLYASGITGKGQHIAIATYMGFSLDDVNEYYRLIDLSPLPIVDIVSFNGTAPYDAGSATETELDVEFSGMMAPGAKIHVFASAQNDDDGELALFTAILDDNRAKVVNYSWGSCETDLSSGHRSDMDKVFARAIAQGVNLLIASGDSGSDGCSNGGIVAGWPALHPDVVAVGGTSLTVNRNGSRHETGWSGSGGGFSSHYKLPKWQSNFKSPFVRRSFPDISFNADPGTGEGMWVRSDLNSAPDWQVIGGTSMASPQWTGYLTLINEARVEKGFKQLGFLNPIIYGASAANKKKIFYDVTSGNNGAYSAGKGWDAVTGWGSMQGAAMYKYLISVGH